MPFEHNQPLSFFRFGIIRTSDRRWYIYCAQALVYEGAKNGTNLRRFHNYLCLGWRAMFAFYLLCSERRYREHVLLSIAVGGFREGAKVKSGVSCTLRSFRWAFRVDIATSTSGRKRPRAWTARFAEMKGVVATALARETPPSGRTARDGITPHNASWKRACTPNAGFKPLGQLAISDGQPQPQLNFYSPSSIATVGPEA